MTPTDQIIIDTIDQAPLNRGLSGASWLATQGNVPVLFDSGDLVLFDFEGQHTYQIHVVFVSRGRAAIRAVLDALHKIFTEYRAELVFGMVPKFRREVSLLARWTGFKFAGDRQTVDGPCELFVLSDIMWKGATR